MRKKKYAPLSQAEEEIGKAVVDAAYQVHYALGPGLLERIYEVCFSHVLMKQGFKVLRQLDVPIVFDDLVFEEGLRLDVLVNDMVIFELKALENVNPVWEAQLLSHLEFGTCQVAVDPCLAIPYVDLEIEPPTENEIQLFQFTYMKSI